MDRGFRTPDKTDARALKVFANQAAVVVEADPREEFGLATESGEPDRDVRR
jgi:hypothetical protein